jgi:hypothetical protein
MSVEDEAGSAFAAALQRRDGGFLVAAVGRRFAAAWGSWALEF